MMRLAIDTSGPTGSVAVAYGADVLARVLLERQGRHAADLVPAIEDTLQEAGVDRAEIGGVIVGEGPGSFTGVRVAAATAKGLVRALSVPLWPVSSLAAAALGADPSSASAQEGRVVYALFDARSDRVYGAAYRVDEEGVTEFVPPHAGVVAEALNRALPPGTTFVGDGAEKHRALIEAEGHVVNLEAGCLADGLVRYQALTGAEPVAEPAAWEPRYVRMSSAERLWPK